MSDFKFCAEGKKFDEDKLRVDLVPVSLIKAVAHVLGFGAKKYGEGNWRSGIDYHRVYGAVLRHLLAWWDGEDRDSESGFPHLWHAACELAFLIEFEDLFMECPEKNRLDDRRKLNEAG